MPASITSNGAKSFRLPSLTSERAAVFPMVPDTFSVLSGTVFFQLSSSKAP